MAFRYFSIPGVSLGSTLTSSLFARPRVTKIPSLSWISSWPFDCVYTASSGTLGNILGIYLRIYLWYPLYDSQEVLSRFLFEEYHRSPRDISLVVVVTTFIAGYFAFFVTLCSRIVMSILVYSFRCNSSLAHTDVTPVPDKVYSVMAMGYKCNRVYVMPHTAQLVNTDVLMQPHRKLCKSERMRTTEWRTIAWLHFKGGLESSGFLTVRRDTDRNDFLTI